MSWMDDKWTLDMANTMVESLKCVVCSKAEVPIFGCQNGHNVCGGCKGKLCNKANVSEDDGQDAKIGCPSCNSTRLERNYLAEDLCTRAKRTLSDENYQVAPEPELPAEEEEEESNASRGGRPSWYDEMERDRYQYQNPGQVQMPRPAQPSPVHYRQVQAAQRPAQPPPTHYQPQTSAPPPPPSNPCHERYFHPRGSDYDSPADTHLQDRGQPKYPREITAPRTVPWADHKSLEDDEPSTTGPPPAIPAEQPPEPKDANQAVGEQDDFVPIPAPESRPQEIVPPHRFPEGAYAGIAPEMPTPISTQAPVPEPTDNFE